MKEPTNAYCPLPARCPVCDEFLSSVTAWYRRDGKDGEWQGSYFCGTSVNIDAEGECAWRTPHEETRSCEIDVTRVKTKG